MSHLNPLAQVKLSCLTATEYMAHVSVIEEEIVSNAATLSLTKKESFCNGVEWDASGWHYNADVESNGPLTVQYIFVMDAMNFCFWPSETNFEYDCLASSLKKVLENDSTAFNAERLANITQV